MNPSLRLRQAGIAASGDQRSGQFARSESLPVALCELSSPGTTPRTTAGERPPRYSGAARAAATRLHRSSSTPAALDALPSLVGSRTPCASPESGVLLQPGLGLAPPGAGAFAVPPQFATGSHVGSRTPCASPKSGVLLQPGLGLAPPGAGAFAVPPQFATGSHKPGGKRKPRRRSITGIPTGHPAPARGVGGAAGKPPPISTSPTSLQEPARNLGHANDAPKRTVLDPSSSSGGPRSSAGDSRGGAEDSRDSNGAATASFASEDDKLFDSVDSSMREMSRSLRASCTKVELVLGTFYESEEFTDSWDSNAPSGSLDDGPHSPEKDFCKMDSLMLSSIEGSRAAIRRVQESLRTGLL